MKRNNVPKEMIVPVKAFIKVRLSEKMTIRELGKFMWMLGCEVDFSVKDIEKTPPRAEKDEVRE